MKATNIIQSLTIAATLSLSFSAEAATGTFRPGMAREAAPVVKAPVSAPAYPRLDPATYPYSGELEVGQATVTTWSGNQMDAFLPKVSWAIALAHASKLTELYGVGLTPSEIMAVSVDLMALGCDPGNDELPYVSDSLKYGCFDFDPTYVYPDLQAAFPGRFARSHADTVAGSHFEGAALAFAFNAARTTAELDNDGLETASFFNKAHDPTAVLKISMLNHIMGSENRHMDTIFIDERAMCESTTNLTSYPASSSCVTNQSTSDLLRWTADHSHTFEASVDNFYDAAVSWSDVQAYMASIAAIYPEVYRGDVIARVNKAFNEVAVNGLVGFRADFGWVLDSLVLALPAPAAPVVP